MPSALPCFKLATAYQVTSAGLFPGEETETVCLQKMAKAPGL